MTGFIQVFMYKCLVLPTQDKCKLTVPDFLQQLLKPHLKTTYMWITVVAGKEAFTKLYPSYTFQSLQKFVSVIQSLEWQDNIIQVMEQFLAYD